MHRLSYTTSLNRHTQFTALHMFPRNATPSGKRTVSLPSSLRILKSEAGIPCPFLQGEPFSCTILDVPAGEGTVDFVLRSEGTSNQLPYLYIMLRCILMLDQGHSTATTNHMREAEQAIATREPTVHHVTIAQARRLLQHQDQSVL